MERRTYEAESARNAREKRRRGRKENEARKGKKDVPLSLRRNDISVLELVVDLLDSHSDGVLVEFLLRDVRPHDGCREG